MFDLKGYAYRNKGVIHVTISGHLPNSCYSAKIIDKYPGGNVTYVRDPGNAQVFIDESVKPSSGVCLMYLVPWVSHTTIIDLEHEKVEFLVNGEPVTSIEVKEKVDNFRVITLTASESSSFTGCSIIPSDAEYLAIYSSAFEGSLTDCINWRKSNCVKPLGGEWPFPLNGNDGDPVPGPFPF